MLYTNEKKNEVISLKHLLNNKRICWNNLIRTLGQNNAIAKFDQAIRSRFSLVDG